jgi:enoyl-CoA hydratase/carnithine racemase
MHLKLQRPEKKNAMHAAMLDQFNKVMRLASADPKVKVLLIYGAEGNLSAGNDLKAVMASEKQRTAESFMQLCWDVVTFNKIAIYVV